MLKLFFPQSSPRSTANKSLLSSRFAVTEEGSFLAVTDLALFSATHKLLNEEDTIAVASYFLHFHTTHRPDVAFSLLRILAVLRPMIPSSVVAVNGEYQKKQVQISVTDVDAKPRSDLIVFIREGENDQIKLHFDKNRYVAKVDLDVGEHVFTVKVGMKTSFTG